MLHFLRFKAFQIGEWFIQTKLSHIFTPIAWIWAFVSMIRHWLYDAKWLPTFQVDVPVVSIGNLSFGGSGKTPLVILLAKLFPNRKVAILARGYGAKVGEWNDEMKVIARHLPAARLYQGADRVKLAQQAVADGADWILLDDGFQHRRLYRDFDLLIVRPRDFLDSFLPVGHLRDSPKRVAKADALFSYAPLSVEPKPILLRTKVTRIVDRFGCEIDSIRGERVALFCGIGQPERFKQTVADLGAVIAAEKILVDHEPFLGVESFFEEYKYLNIKYLVCTEKDFVKLAKPKFPIAWIEIESEVVGGMGEWQKLVAKIGDRLNN